MKLSFSTFPYMNYTLEEAVARLAGWGYDAVEIWGGSPHAYAYDMDAARIKSARDALARHGMGISAFIPAQFRYPVSLCIADDGIRKAGVAYVKRGIEVGAELGAGIVTVCPGHSVYPQSRQSAWENLRASLAELAGHARSNGVMLALEPAHPMESDLVQTSDDALLMLEETGDDSLKILLDTGHVHLNKEPLPDAVRKLKEHLALVHFDDNHGLYDEHLIPGSGAIDFIPFLKELRAAGYDGCITLELGYNWVAAPDEAAHRGVLAAKDILKAF